MNIFTHDARVLKFDLLRKTADLAFNDELSEAKLNAYYKTLIPNGRAIYRCCVYKEREILRQRGRLVRGLAAGEEHPKGERQIVQVIDAACDGCTINKVQVTDNCRKCLAKSCLAACRFGAISMGSERAQIDYQKCKECGACARACAYNAIVITERPCKKACPVDAISWDENKIAQIDEDKCINCGRCLAACPFGAIEDVSWIVPVIEAIKKGEQVIALVAPAIQGQFEDTSLDQIKSGIRQLGFADCLEVASGADLVAKKEYQELLAHKKQGIPLTTSCCPAFVNLAKKHFPKVYEENVSITVSPMIAEAKLIKQQYPACKTVFIGPCIAKKQEALTASAVDYVLTFEEIAAMLIAKHIYLKEVVAKKKDNTASKYGRGFAIGGGVSAALNEFAQESHGEKVTAYYADGADECKKQLVLIAHKRFTADILEGMCCNGGCINGPCGIEDATTVKMRMHKENLAAEATIQASLAKNNYREETIELHYQK